MKVETINRAIKNMEIEFHEVETELSTGWKWMEVYCSLATVIGDEVMVGDIVVRPFGKEGKRVGMDGTMHPQFIEFIRSTEAEADIVCAAMQEAGLEDVC